MSYAELPAVLSRRTVRATGEVQLYGVWEGEEGSPPKGVINARIEHAAPYTLSIWHNDGGGS
jgi:hypothetical protein